jgi:hypothetical protein
VYKQKIITGWTTWHRARRGEDKNFLAFKENIRTENNVLTEHMKADQGPGEEIFNLAWPAFGCLAERDLMISIIQIPATDQ